MYLDYITKLDQDSGYDGVAANQAPVMSRSQVSSNVSSYGIKTPVSTNETDDQEDDESESHHSASSHHNQDMINISGCEFEEFQAYMTKQFGDR